MMAMYRKNNESVFGVEEMVTGRFKAKSIEESGEQNPNPNPGWNILHIATSYFQ
jgi:hypothetical protein